MLSLHGKNKTLSGAAVDHEARATMVTTYHSNDKSRSVVTGSILDLPIGILLDVSEYLSQPSRVKLESTM